MTAYGGSKGVNFQQAIVQSPGWIPISNLYVQENTTNWFYKYANVSSLAEARQLNSSAVIRANALQVGLSRYGTYTYGPTVDGVFVTSHPGLALQNGQYAKNITLMMGHNTNEGPFFAPSFVTSNADLSSWLQSSYPLAAPQTLDYVTSTLYPPVYDGSQNYTSPVTRAIKIITEQIFTCNTNYLTRAANNDTHNYEFQVPPALHGNDVAYFFWNGESGVRPNIATTLQKYITNFAASGDPNGPGLPTFPIQGMNASEIGLNITGINVQVDPTVNQRCRWWQKYLYT